MPYRAYSPRRLPFAGAVLILAAALVPGGLGLLASHRLSAYEVVVTDPVYGRVNASALDQPRLFALLTDPQNGDQPITHWVEDWWTGQLVEEPVLIRAFIDTGASGFAISRLHAGPNAYEVPHFGWGPTDFEGVFTEIGVGGEELGEVTRPFGVRVLNGSLQPEFEPTIADFTPYGHHRLWVRPEVGFAEVQEVMGFPIVSPLNLVGMPVIRQGLMIMDLSSLVNPFLTLEPIKTFLVPAGSPEPVTQATIALELRDFVGPTAPPGETMPSQAENPMVKAVTVTHGSASVTSDWLFDTGAGSSFVDVATARALGFIGPQFATLAEFTAAHRAAGGKVASIGGIGEPQEVPILTVDRVSVATREGATMVWTQVDLMVLDIAGLEGVFGMNLLVGSVTIGIDDDPLLALFDISPGLCTHAVVDVTEPSDPVLRLAVRALAGTAFAWLGTHFTGPERLDPAVGSWLADANGDGLPNLVAYALGLDPRGAAAAAVAARPQATWVDVAGQLHAALRFTRPAGGRPDVRYRAEVSNDLVQWRHGPAEVELHAVSPAGGERETVTFRAAAPAAGNSRWFLRLVVELVALP
jgi:hypothetical protein